MNNRISIYTKEKSDEQLSRKLLCGTVAPRWSSASSYSKNDIVERNAVLYRAKLASNGRQPESSTSYWERTSTIAKDGVTPSKLLAKEFYCWNPRRSYSTGSLVLKDGMLYVCQSDTTGAWNPSKWKTEYLAASGDRAEGEITAQHGALLSGNGTAYVTLSGNARIRSKGDGRTLVFESGGMSSELVVDGTDVLTSNRAFRSNVPTYSNSAFSEGEWTWYGAAAGSGLYVSKVSKAVPAPFNPSDWNGIDSLSSMFGSSNVAAVRNVRGKDGDMDILLAKVCGQSIYAPPPSRALVVEACISGSTAAVSGETLSAYEGTDSSGTLVGVKPYDGQPVSFEITGSGLKSYFVKGSNNRTQATQPTATVSTSGVAYVTLTYARPTTFAGLASAIASVSSTEAANSLFAGLEISDKWVSEDGAELTDPMICTAVKDYADSSGTPHRGAKLVRKYASLHSLPFCTTGRYTYVSSTIRQYLNSSATSGAWHSTLPPPPENYNSIRGYMAGCSNALTAAVHTVAVSTMDDRGSVTHVTHDKFFVDSIIERYGTRFDGLTDADGTYDKYWKDRTSFPGGVPSRNADDGRITYAVEQTGTAKDVHLRNMDATMMYSSYNCLTDGSILSEFILAECRMAPCCVIW